MRPRSARGWASAYYFLYFAAGAAFWPFMILYYQNRGLSGSEIGILAAVSPLVSLWAAPFWTGFADAGNRHRAVFLIATVCAAASLILISQSGSLWLLLILVPASSLFGAPLNPLMDHAVVTMLGAESPRYGRIRLWGSIGWGVAAPLAGWFIQQHGLSWAYRIGAFLLATSIIASLGVPFTGQEHKQSYWRGARTLLADRKWWLFLFISFIAGMGLTSVDFLFAYLDDLGATKGFMGVAQTVGTISELPFFFFAAALLKRYRARGLLVIGLLAIGVRCLLYWAVHSPWGIMLIQLMNGLTFSLTWSAGVAFAMENAPPGLGATAQGLFGAFVFGFGGSAGGFLAGNLLGSIGASAMYGVFALIIFAGLAVFLLGERVLVRPNVQKGDDACGD